MAKIYEVFGTNAHEMTMTLMQASNAAAMIPKGASIALKPNLVLAGEPETGTISSVHNG